MDKCFIIVNVFFIPTIALFINYRCNKEQKRSWFEWFLMYTTYVVAIMLISGLVRYIIRWLFNKSFEVYSFRYMIVAVLVTLIITLPFNFYNFKFELKSRKELNKSKETEEPKETNEEMVTKDVKKTKNR